MTLITRHSGKNYILYDESRFGNDAEPGFDRQSLVKQGAILGAAAGRGTTLFIQCNGMDVALRHYHRGGLVARFLSDQYFWSGLVRTRAWHEFHLLRCLQQMSLPVCEPVAAHVERNGLFYRADLMTLRIPQSQTLAQQLSHGALGQKHWQAVGQCVRRFHQAGVYHADLNANNILLDDQHQVHLIDFDRGEIRKPAPHWQQANLERLLRSLNKIKSQQATFYFSESDWHDLLQGYQQ